MRAKRSSLDDFHKLPQLLLRFGCNRFFRVAAAGKSLPDQLSNWVVQNSLLRICSVNATLIGKDSSRTGYNPAWRRLTHTRLALQNKNAPAELIRSEAEIQKKFGSDDGNCVLSVRYGIESLRTAIQPPASPASDWRRQFLPSKLTVLRSPPIRFALRLLHHG